ncbi:hypothetical protein [Mameliella sediminis]|uniref:hypothetical protein n=1 Tax=Mameliella sediminis TaxID=2836866 RepID=UPI001C492610|nr:hypothetical protein [Mameliella sediminis]MBV7396849.1 hypothetical protein [Mameliella sediminis]MBY6116193.1 hypothetical protein [Antarctobacter heliothermus]MBY6146158.1 hypothetical protein [Mameliella alba]MCA0955343.1 hypothetical protein [Mameliella alba]
MSKSLDSQGIKEHRALLAVELEVMAKKMDRFGWEPERGTAAHDRLMTDWMDALQDFTLEEVKSACKKWVRNNPRKMPNEGDILNLIGIQRQEEIAEYKAKNPPPEEPRKERVSPERAKQILEEIGFRPQRFGSTATES